MGTVAPVAIRDMPLQAFVDHPWTEYQQVVVPRQPVRDIDDESLQVFEAVGLTGGLRAATAAVADGGIVPDVSGGPTVSRHLRLHSLQASLIAPYADDDSLRRVDPYDSDGSRFAHARPVGAACRGHERAHAGPASASSARSA
jgi:hypothetical protein